jgi:hypothetical protein
MNVWSLLVTAALFAVSAAAEEQCLSDAWAALNRSDHQAAIRAADTCITQFHLKAEREQAALANRREPEPPTGAVSDPDKQKIFSRGVLNDVAAAYIVKGQASKALAAKASAQNAKKVNYPALARNAYGEARKLTYARVWDVKGFFWSPAEAAGDSLTDLSK